MVSSRRAAVEAFEKAQDDEIHTDDELDDNTRARASKPKFKHSGEKLDQKGRLQLRAPLEVPEKYKGKVVSRKELKRKESEEEENVEEDDVEEDGEGSELESASDGGSEGEMNADEMAAFDAFDAGTAAFASAPSVAAASADVAGSISIDADLEAELQVVQKRSAVVDPRASNDDRKEQAKAVFEQTKLNSKLCELRIGIEGPLQSVRNAAAPKAGQQASGETVASLMMMQRELASKVEGLEVPEMPSGDVWGSYFAPMNAAVREWAIKLADEWKEQTSLEVKRPQFKVLDRSIAAQMAHATEDKERMLSRCHPAGDDGARDHSVYDDRDFYVALLREIVQRSEGNYDEVTKAARDAAGSKKRKRKEVDRRASKGRKIRYVPIPKLANFMAPVPREEVNEATNQLINSLFR